MKTLKKTGRNDPCPCGSGRKHKHCCLRKDTAEAHRRQLRDEGVAKALLWLDHLYPQLLPELVLNDFLSYLGHSARHVLHTITKELRDRIDLNAYDWLLAEGVARIDGEVVFIPEMVLGPRGPRLQPVQRQWLEEHARRPLRPYEVQHVEPGKGMWVRDALDTGADCLWVAEVSASKTLRLWDIFGARLLSWDDDWVRSTACYAVTRQEFFCVRDSLRKLPEAKQNDPREVSALVINCWLDVFIIPFLEVFFEDPYEEFFFVISDGYDVRDWDTLAARLGAQEDVEGDAKHGWDRVVRGREDSTRVRLSINPAEDDRLENYAPTKGLADEGRAWFENVAGDAVSFRSRRTSDPTPSLCKRLIPGPSTVGRSPPQVDESSPETQQEYEATFADWSSEPMPFLDDLSPREALETPGGRERVVELLKTHENGELELAEEEGRRPVDLGFLWRSVGLDRDRIVPVLGLRHRREPPSL